MITRFILLGLLLASQYGVGMPYTGGAVAIAFLFFATMFYYEFFKIAIGLSAIEFETQGLLERIVSSAFIIMNQIFLFMMGKTALYYYLISAYIFPWTLILLAIGVTSYLVQEEIIAIDAKDD